MFTAKEARTLTDQATRLDIRGIQEEIKKAAKVGYDFIVVHKLFCCPKDEVAFFTFLEENGYEIVVTDDGKLVIRW